MVDRTESILPEKCCAKCGFFYAIAKDVELPIEVIFDPDLIRATANLPGDGDISSMHHRNTVGFSNTKSKTITYTLGNTKSLNCLWNIYSYPIDLRATRSGENTRNDVRELISKDRKNECEEYFFPYHPGFSSKEHLEIRLQEQRDQQQREFQERQNNLFLQLEETAANRDLYWKKKAEEAEKKEVNERSLHRWINVISTSFAIIISVINLIIFAFRNP